MSLAWRTALRFACRSSTIVSLSLCRRCPSRSSARHLRVNLCSRQPWRGRSREKFSVVKRWALRFHSNSGCVRVAPRILDTPTRRSQLMSRKGKRSKMPLGRDAFTGPGNGLFGFFEAWPTTVDYRLGQRELDLVGSCFSCLSCTPPRAGSQFITRTCSERSVSHLLPLRSTSSASTIGAPGPIPQPSAGFTLLAADHGVHGASSYESCSNH